MVEETQQKNVRVRANSPGRYPILIVELSSGELRAVYHETGYDLERSKPVKEEWLYENAIGRHSFVEVDPPQTLTADSLKEYARRKLVEDS